ncbi:MAG TPA: apolipoprotein N-acyltransferase [Opitutales bacterium]|nr:apolipoprotein N-acyltransferase [Opitutales bacterium]
MTAKLIGAFLSGLCFVFGFAPFHFPGLSILSLAIFAQLLQSGSLKSACLTGFVYGIGFFGLGVSWIFVSIHAYAHLNLFFSTLITLLFITYLSSFTSLVALSYRFLLPRTPSLYSGLLFSALWCSGEYCRAHVFGGFPWLMLGFGQIDSPLGQLLPSIGVLGVSAVTCFISYMLLLAFHATQIKRMILLVFFALLMISPLFLAPPSPQLPGENSLSVGVIQANLSMRDKWDETLFWQILEHYKQETEALLGKRQIIVMPESAIPLPSQYVSDYLERLDAKAKKTHTAVILGIPDMNNADDALLFNALLGLGSASGIYYKQHLVAFGEFIPTFLVRLSQWLELPLPNMTKGQSRQALLRVFDHPVATLICYELAFPELLRQQLPLAEWIISISDDGWFGHSFAVYQHLQMAQVLSKETHRFQIISNNDGLSSVINASGEIIDSLPAFTTGVLNSAVIPNTEQTPWVNFGDTPVHVFLILMLLYSFIHALLSKKLLPAMREDGILINPVEFQK